MKQISRFGAYGIVLQQNTILLAQKKAGPYAGLWDLPGGGIEFGETPELALERELFEETGIKSGKIEFLYHAVHTLSAFHQVGMIYQVFDWSQTPEAIPEEKTEWMQIQNISCDILTPFAKQALLYVKKKYP